MKPAHRISILLALLLIAGCGGEKNHAKKTLFSDDPSVAIGQVQAMFPKGISEAEAASRLKEIGLEVSLLENEKWSNHMLVGSIREGGTEWTIGLSIMNGVVSFQSVNLTSQR